MLSSNTIQIRGRSKELEQDLLSVCRFVSKIKYFWCSLFCSYLGNGATVLFIPVLVYVGVCRYEFRYPNCKVLYREKNSKFVTQSFTV